MRRIFRGMNWALWLLATQAIGWLSVGIIVLAMTPSSSVSADDVFLVVGSWAVTGILGMFVVKSVRLEREDNEGRLDS